MTLISSVSGIRGTIGAKPSEGLSPIDAVKFAAAYGMYLRTKHTDASVHVVIGRDARPSGAMIQGLVTHTLIGMGIHVLDIGLATTPTVEMAVPYYKAQAGIIITASHNPIEWNGIKLLNELGEFISPETGQAILNYYQAENYLFAPVQELGKHIICPDFLPNHIQSILALSILPLEKIRNYATNLKIALDGINSVGQIAVPALLQALGVKAENIFSVYQETDGWFQHNPEPLKANLTEVSRLVKEKECHLGIAVDPDVDRLVWIDEQGELFGEEYTLVMAADYVLSKTHGSTVSNLSSSRALKDLTQSYGQNYYASAVGEVHVVKKMKEVHAVIGGEGNGGVIYPQLHYGRDALVGITLGLALFSELEQPLSSLKNRYSAYEMVKDKMPLPEQLPLNQIYLQLKNQFPNEEFSQEDGIKIDFTDGWVHLRPSNTEPILRIYAEAKSQRHAEQLIQTVKNCIL